MRLFRQAGTEEGSLQPFAGTSAHFCARCGDYEVPMLQRHLSGWNYEYYCCEASTLRVVPKEPKAFGTSIKTARDKQDRYRVGGAEAVLEALQAEPLSLDHLIEASGLTRGSLINLITKLRRDGKVVTARRKGPNAVSWVGLIEHRERVEAIEQQLNDSRPTSKKQDIALAFLSGNPAPLRTIASALFGGNPDNCRNTLLALKRRGFVVSRKTSTSVASEVWFCLTGQEALLAAALDALDDVDRPAITQYCHDNPGCIEKQIVIDLKLTRDRTRRTLERMAVDGDVTTHTLHRWKRYTLTPQGISKCSH